MIWASHHKTADKKDEIETAKAQRAEIDATLAKLRAPGLAILPDHFVWQLHLCTQKDVSEEKEAKAEEKMAKAARIPWSSSLAMTNRWS